MSVPDFHRRDGYLQVELDGSLADGRGIGFNDFTARRYLCFSQQHVQAAKSSLPCDAPAASAHLTVRSSA